MAAAMLVGVGCASGDATQSAPPADAVRIASFDFAESELIAELYAQTLEDAGVPVERLGPLGPREIVEPALQQNVVDLVPEYLGTAATYFGAETIDLRGLGEVLGPRGLVALDPAPAEDVNVVVVTEQTARDLELETVSDLAPVAPGMTFGGPVECPERPLCLIGLRQTYDLTFADFVPQRTLAITAEALRHGEIDVGMMFSTSGEFDESEFVMLVDDLQLQPPENIVPIVTVQAHERWGALIEPALDVLSASLTTRSVRAMNGWIADDQTVAAVARWWLEGLRASGA